MVRQAVGYAPSMIAPFGRPRVLLPVLHLRSSYSRRWVGVNLLGYDPPDILRLPDAGVSRTGA